MRNNFGGGNQRMNPYGSGGNSGGGYGKRMATRNLG